MIELQNISKTHYSGGVQTLVADNISAIFPSGSSLALLGRNGAGKTTLLRLISGAVQPDNGRIVTSGSISWPVGFAGSFHGDLTGVQNARFVARIYGVDSDELTEFVEQFSELGKHFGLPFRTYSAGMRARFAFGVSMAIRFDTYLIDEVTSVGDELFRVKSEQLLLQRLKTSGAVVVSHNLRLVERVCDIGAVIHNGNLHMFSSVSDAIECHKQNMGLK